MPVYEFKCLKCENSYEELTPYDETGKYKKIKCSECGSRRKERLMSSTAFTFTNPEGTGRWNSETSGHDYRFKHNQPKMAKDRAEAERLSHMGSQPYNPIDDISSGEHFGEVR
jgi:putative FmdB family regulatory protein